MNNNLNSKNQASDQPVVFVVDDEENIREGLSSLLRSVNLQVKTFASTREFMNFKLPDAPACLVLDVRMPGMSGLDFQAELANMQIRLPIVFISGHADVPMSVKAMKRGAIEFLTKPIREQDLLDAVRVAIERDRSERQKAKMGGDLRNRLDSLTSREREVFGLVASGLMNKQIAGELDIREVTVKVHRGNVMRKMGARSLAALVRMADATGVHPARQSGGTSQLGKSGQQNGNSSNKGAGA
jgi:FixJ family two-component response regulator